MRTIPIPITDPADPRLADFGDLARADRRPDRPGGQGLVIAEGVPVVRRLLASAYPVRAVLGVPAKLELLADDLTAYEHCASAAAGHCQRSSANVEWAPLPVLSATAEVMADVVGFQLNRGVLASADRVVEPAVPELLAGARRIAVLEGVNDHENIGVIFRNAAAFGLDAVLLGPGCSDPLYRRSVRVSMGNVLAVPFAQLVPDRIGRVGQPIRAGREEIAGGLEMLAANGFEILACTPRADAQALSTIDPERSPRTAVLLGAEGPGLSELALRHAGRLVRIPMHPDVDSLNVATAAALAFARLSPYR